MQSDKFFRAEYIFSLIDTEDEKIASAGDENNIFISSYDVIEKNRI